uniref:NADH-ubiquinone oxidoreductase chain 2 n=1 Tax=Tomoxia bucephala TaxID=295979 RepID=A0A343C1Y3_9CUCU|nr:NADH dehydrogenase subunit 2 [Tomoxia bucephala]
MMKFNKIMFTNSLVLGTLIAISSQSWLSMWMGLEINLLSMIPLLSSSKNPLSTEASMKYFLTQVLASLILMFSIMALMLKSEFISLSTNKWLYITMTSALMTKLGAAPFHFWFPEVMEGLSWNNCLIMLTWQKIAPMALIMNMNANWIFLTTVIITSMIVGGLMGMNQVSLRKIMTFSSINHIGWMLAAMSVSSSHWTWYFTIYSMLTLNIVTLFKWTKAITIKQLINSMSKNKMIKLSFLMNFMSLGGLPPFLGFMPKWLVINALMSKNQPALSIIMVIVTLVSLYIYIRILSNSMMMMNVESKLITPTKKYSIMASINIMSSTLIILSTILFNLF